MKRMTVTLLAGSFLMLIGIVIATNNAAAAPVCYKAIDSENTAGVDCAEFEGLNLITAEALFGENANVGTPLRTEPGEVMQDGFCYLWGEHGVAKYAIDGPDCKNLQFVGVANVFKAPTCYKYEGPAMNVYQGFEVTKLKTVECTEIEAEAKEQLNLTELGSNTCYVLGADNDITVPRCQTLERSIESGNEAALNPDREAVTNCDNPQECFETNPIVRLILQFINFLSIGIGVVVTIVIIVGGIQYMTAGPNPQAVSAAKKRITNAILALLAYFLLYAFLQWVVPGGIL